MTVGQQDRGRLPLPLDDAIDDLARIQPRIEHQAVVAAGQRDDVGVFLEGRRDDGFDANFAGVQETALPVGAAFG